MITIGLSTASEAFETKASYRVMDNGHAVVTIKCQGFTEDIVVLNEAHAINLVEIIQGIK